MQVYTRQKEHRRRHGRYSAAWEDLGIGSHQGPEELALLETTSVGFVAAIALTLPDGSRELWRIREDSRIWSEKITGESS